MSSAAVVIDALRVNCLEDSDRWHQVQVLLSKFERNRKPQVAQWIECWPAYLAVLGSIIAGGANQSNVQ